MHAHMASIHFKIHSYNPSQEITINETTKLTKYIEPVNNASEGNS